MCVRFVRNCRRLFLKDKSTRCTIPLCSREEVWQTLLKRNYRVLSLSFLSTGYVVISFPTFNRYETENLLLLSEAPFLPPPNSFTPLPLCDWVSQLSPSLFLLLCLYSIGGSVVYHSLCAPAWVKHFIAHVCKKHNGILMHVYPRLHFELFSIIGKLLTIWKNKTLNCLFMPDDSSFFCLFFVFDGAEGEFLL